MQIHGRAERAQIHLLAAFSAVQVKAKNACKGHVVHAADAIHLRVDGHIRGIRAEAHAAAGGVQRQLRHAFANPLRHVLRHAAKRAFRLGFIQSTYAKRRFAGVPPLNLWLIYAGDDGHIAVQLVDGFHGYILLTHQIPAQCA